jgi:hypothetical protein
MNFPHRNLQETSIFESYPSCSKGVNGYQEVLNRLHGVDVNALATQMTALHLMLMEPRCPFTRLNLVRRDFFSLTANNLDSPARCDYRQPALH